MESGKYVERDEIIFPIIYNRRNVDIGKLMKDEYLHLQTVMKKSIKARPVIAYTKKPSLIDILVSTRLPTNPVTLLVEFSAFGFVCYSFFLTFPKTLD